MLICNVHSVEFVERKTKDGSRTFWCCPNKLANGDYCRDQGIKKENYESAQAFDNSVSDNRSYRIERQHSQEMAIRSLELLFKINPEAVSGSVASKGLEEVIKALTDKFVEDLDK